MSDLHLAYKSLCAGEERPAYIRQLDAVLRSMEQGDAKLPLQALDVLGQWRLGKAEFFRRSREAQVAGDGNEALKPTKVHESQLPQCGRMVRLYRLGIDLSPVDIGL